MCERAGAIVLAAACCFIQGSVLADSSLVDRSTGDGAPPPSTPLAITSDADRAKPIAAPAVVPVTAVAPAPLATVAPTPSGKPDPAERQERTRIISYIILQGLQGAGPFAGGR